MPSCSKETSLANLKSANQVRLHRARVKREVAAADTKPDSVQLLAWTIVDPEPELWGMRVQDLILALPGVGRDKLRSILLGAQVGSDRQVGDLTVRQQLELAGQLSRWGRLRGRVRGLAA